ncbi:hypothetical protein G9A89_003480 [Geosiphon pyriformis]|nr:hypothetical protein G9A89_003480 [Geosiphon pyriformis]
MGGMISFFAAGVFVDDTIWVGSSQAVTQFILDVASNFFVINDISINNDKTVTISINQRVQNAAFKISELSISIVRCGMPHRCLSIFLLTDSLSKFSLAKAQSNIKFFSNMKLGSVDVTGGVVAFFPKIGLSIGVRVMGLLSFMMTELQTVVLALKFVNHMYWKIGPGSKILSGFSVCDIDWIRTMAVWHPNLGMLSGSKSRNSADLHSYFIKAVYSRLSVAIRKRLYNKNYSGVLCLHCEKVKFSDHVFTCNKEFVFYKEILFKCVSVWRSLAGSYCPTLSVVLESLILCVSNIGLYALFYKSFVLIEWFKETMQIFENCKEAVQVLVNFVQNVDVCYCFELWEFRSRFKANMEKNNLVSDLRVLPAIYCSSVQGLLNGTVRLIGINDSFGVNFGFHKPWLFFSGLVNMVSVHINV